MIEDEEETLVPVNLLTERLCSLIPLDHMSSARCGFGTAVIDDIMIVLGTTMFLFSIKMVLLHHVTNVLV